ncbi:MAG TPA: type II toxin-antitoxin system RelE/ParE family toxin [Dehalococcoidia bacterium]|nr:type II toxin-antitoxin system RelE/ParE family toxin [Dehalococcoidia bacterium]
MPYIIEFSARARRQFAALPRRTQQRLQPHIDALAENSRPVGVKKMAGGESEYRIRVGSYRVVYEIRDRVLIVYVVAVGDRRDVYRGPR